jgi:hypothetical protein
MNNEFITEPNDELKRVTEEINFLRRDMQAASALLGRIEKRLKAAFPSYPIKQKQPKEKGQRERTHSSKTPQELQAIFEDLVVITHNGGDSAFVAKVSAITDEDIIALSVEVGMGSHSRLSRHKAEVGVRKRVQEALQLQFEKKGNFQHKNPSNQA